MPQIQKSSPTQLTAEETPTQLPIVTTPPMRSDDLLDFFFPITIQLKNAEPATAANYEVFFIADFPCEVIEAMEAHRVAATGGTLDLEKLTGTQGLDGGVAILASTFDLTGTANTVVRKKAAVNSNRTLKPGDRLALKDSGTLTSLAGLCITIYIRPLFFKLQNI